MRINVGSGIYYDIFDNDDRVGELYILSDRMEYLVFKFISPNERKCPQKYTDTITADQLPNPKQYSNPVMYITHLISDTLYPYLFG